MLTSTLNKRVLGQISLPSGLDNTQEAAAIEKRQPIEVKYPASLAGEEHGLHRSQLLNAIAHYRETGLPEMASAEVVRGFEAEPHRVGKPIRARIKAFDAEGNPIINPKADAQPDTHIIYLSSGSRLVDQYGRVWLGRNPHPMEERVGDAPTGRPKMAGPSRRTPNDLHHSNLANPGATEAGTAERWRKAEHAQAGISDSRTERDTARGWRKDWDAEVGSSGSGTTAQTLGASGWRGRSSTPSPSARSDASSWRRPSEASPSSQQPKSRSDASSWRKDDQPRRLERRLEAVKSLLWDWGPVAEDKYHYHRNTIAHAVHDLTKTQPILETAKRAQVVRTWHQPAPTDKHPVQSLQAHIRFEDARGRVINPYGARNKGNHPVRVFLDNGKKFTAEDGKVWIGRSATPTVQTHETFAKEG
ncbi:hypothetical protein IE81DRAFT_142248 [Ceraceosorus guamensis]|uniref:Uncharacterized protein n=1 Tax=Ceraceosorus guamensis TaxID=1522189 RepID=A0A316VXS7_9BASI|nr:hypothetical protein IE81DRAFT_142248 [Ceraceosorus guamensis]PWN42259.1 hypothetical protein IE81DRAFT_142248 [Ceraceosorus guamensis]